MSPNPSPYKPKRPAQQEEGGGDDKSGDESYCRDVINKIRRDEFGVGKVFDDESILLFEKQNFRIGRALKRLAHELYSHDTHFVLELVQNADDNSYYDDVIPSMQFYIQI